MYLSIQNKLHELETQNDIEILHAVESGSRAWGFSSPDSDYDIRFIYKRNLQDYITLWDKPDVIEFMTSEDLDGSGWDLPKALKLLAKSNAPLIEWLFSTQVYYKQDNFLYQMQEFAKHCFSPIATMHHYLGTTRNFMEACSLEQVKLKNYFYALRTALAGKWIIENNSFPPVAFAELIPLAPKDTQQRIIELLDIKAQMNEKYLHQKETIITKFLIDTIAFNKKYASSLASGKKINNELNEFFKNEILR